MKRPRVIIVGAGGRVGGALLREWQRAFDLTGFTHAQLDLGDFAAVRAALQVLEFDSVVNCAAQTNVDRCETERAEAFRLNAEAPGVLAEICAAKKARLIHLSTDYVFDGEKRTPYLESDPAGPISVYGESKLAGEERVLAVSSRNLVVRVSWVFGPDRPSFIDAIIRRARESEAVEAIADKFSTPTYTLDLAKMLSRFAVAGVGDPGAAAGDRGETGTTDPGYSGILHLANSGECSWQEYGQHALDCCQDLGIPLRAKTVGALKLSDMKSWSARRPVYSVLSTAKYSILAGERPRDWREAVREYIKKYISK